jgi:putative membrane protein
MLTCQSLKKSLLFSIFLTVALFGFTSCGGNREVDSKEVATTLNEPKSDATKERDEKFLVRAAEINFEEIMLGKLVQQRTVSEDLKAMAKMFEETHRTANVELRALAMSKSIAVPTAATKNVMDHYDQLNLKPTNEFDREYCGMAVKNHQEAISYFESYTNGPCDQDIKIWALGVLPDMRIHLQKAMDMELQITSPVSELVRENERVRG